VSGIAEKEDVLDTCLMPCTFFQFTKNPIQPLFINLDRISLTHSTHGQWQSLFQIKSMHLLKLALTLQTFAKMKDMMVV